MNIPSEPLYKVNQRVTERKKACLGITDRDIRSHSKKRIEGKLSLKICETKVRYKKREFL